MSLEQSVVRASPIVRGTVAASRWPLLVATAAILFCVILTALLLGADASTYYAAGERLNAGHLLYALSPGDRPIPTYPPYWTVPLLSPPLIAVIFRPLALLPIQVADGLWVGAQMLAIGFVVVRVVRDWPSAFAVVLLALPIGLGMVIGNINGFFVLAYYLVWQYREHPQIGAGIGLMVALKILPFPLVGFLIARRDGRALAWFVVALVACGAAGLIGAGWQSNLDYLAVITSSAPQPGSLPQLTGIRWLSPMLLLAGTAVAALLPERWSFRVALATIVFGAPGLGPAAMSQLLPALATRGPILRSGDTAKTTALEGRPWLPD